MFAQDAARDAAFTALGTAARSELIAAAYACLETLTDYCGYSDTEGWRRGVAHTADLLLQLSLNPQVRKPQAKDILAAVALKVGTPDHAYI